MREREREKTVGKRGGAECVPPFGLVMSTNIVLWNMPIQYILINSYENLLRVQAIPAGMRLT